MSQIISEMPVGFEPYSTLNFCSNMLVNVKVPIAIKQGLAPLLIGRGASPRVWMSAGHVMNDQQAFFQIVKDNVSNSPQVRIVTGSNFTEVLFGDTIMCHVKQISNDEAAVTKLDLRPAGLVLFGDENSLNVGSNKMDHTTIKNAMAFLSIG
ncbi:hypothetical protein WI93_12100 [Burkholderia vietnamiensis]|uniref:hypothetical protein n=1 Tax=Burkholderia vietnamiensis TaxID=60552 RepID=UPI00075B13A3|nr:hypothetical protein [Burkholderia vietnamiensis]KVE27768.1 hypothetical protein WI93_12100 [Burkholderia vietnamiensis]